MFGNTRRLITISKQHDLTDTIL